MLYKTKPRNFSPKIEVVSCFLQCRGKILLLHRGNNRPQGGTWGVPAGKVEKGETINHAIVRELKEETSLYLPEAGQNYFGKYFVKYSDFDFIYHIFSADLLVCPLITLDKSEHSEFKWMAPVSAIRKNLIEDLDDCIKIFFAL